MSKMSTQCLSTTNKQTKSHVSLITEIFIPSFQREAATEELITPLGRNQQTCGREKCD